LLIVISGPTASGKSTVARALARHFERTGTRVAVIELDLIHEKLQSLPGAPADTDTAWSLARREAATEANELLESSVTVVIAEGSFTDVSKRGDFVDRLISGVTPIYVTLLVSFDEALRRAQRDPTRGTSRNPSFLRAHHAKVSIGLAQLPPSDIVIDTEQLTEDESALAIAELIRDR
jgi:adenylylsulfate kinase-like enzyme